MAQIWGSAFEVVKRKADELSRELGLHRLELFSERRKEIAKLAVGDSVDYVPAQQIEVNRLRAKLGDEKYDNLYKSATPVEPPPEVVEYFRVTGQLDVDLHDPDLVSLLS